MDALPPLACNGCRKCCIGDEVLLSPGDDPARFKTKLRPDGKRALARKKDGNCVYLGSRGCTIQFDKPQMCRFYDCRNHALAIAKMTPYMQAARLEQPSVLEGIARLRAAGVQVSYAGELA